MRSWESMSDSGANLTTNSRNTQHRLATTFLDVFAQATARIGEEYFQLPVAGREAPLYRERVYCYELYHRLRLTMDDYGLGHSYMLCGELDKSGHPYIRGGSLERVKPDFLVHEPLSMTNNLVAIEVKPVARIIQGKAGAEAVRRRAIGQDEIEKDLRSLTAFCKVGGYLRAIYLIYGNDDNRFQQIRATAADLSNKLGIANIDLGLIDLYLHRENGQRACRQVWL
jgi:hypothetical protein